jgi:hypothetical protein
LRASKPKGFVMVTSSVLRGSPPEPYRCRVATANPCKPNLQLLSLEYPELTADDPLWEVVGAGKGTGEPVARHHEEYLYRKDG